MGQRRFANGVHIETDGVQLLVIEKIAPIEDESWFGHRFIDGLVIEGSKLGPIGQDGDGMGAFSGRVRVRLEADELGSSSQVGAGIIEGVRIGQNDIRAFLQ